MCKGVQAKYAQGPLKGGQRGREERFGEGIVDGKSRQIPQDPLIDRLIHSFFNYVNLLYGRLWGWKTRDMSLPKTLSLGVGGGGDPRL